jgi:protocatechuate 3,4-dioxygenase beta subunit
MEGPYYMAGAPLKDSLYPEGTPGTPLVISGTVYGSDCTPLAGAEVDVWQADNNGEYDFSDQFIGRGKVLTDENGRYEFRTILPGRYEPRPPHIHIKIRHPQAVELTTQIYFAGNDNSGQQGVVIAPTQDGDTLRGTFDVVLANS